jgi:hypothetical protein
MSRLITLSTIVLVLITISSCREEKSPDLLVRDLVSAAQTGDPNGLLALMTDRSRKTVEEALANRTALLQAHQQFQQALAEKFGREAMASEETTPDLAKILRQLKGMEIVSRSSGPDGTTQLNVRSSVETSPGRIVVQEDVLLVRQEGGVWKLDGYPVASDSANALRTAERLRSQTATLRDLTQQVRDGRFRDRDSALLALDRASWLPPAPSPEERIVMPPGPEPQFDRRGPRQSESVPAVTVNPEATDATTNVRRQQPVKP